MKKKGAAVEIQTFTVTRKIRLEEKKCPQCQRYFKGRVNKTFCSRACVQKSSYERNAEARRAHRREVYRAQQDTTTKKEKKKQD
jgi:Zn-finger nucleic acid-binding protein